MVAGVVVSITANATAAVAGVVLFVLPGLLVLRRNQLALIERFVLSVGLSLALSTGVLTAAGLAFRLSIPTLLVGAIVLVIAAVRFPLPPDALRSTAPPRTVAIPAALFLIVAVVQALRPALFTTFDAQALWAPLADGIARSGNLTPSWVPTILKGFPPGVAFVAGSISVPAGSLSSRVALLIPPCFGALTLLMSVMVAGRFGVRGSRAMTWAVLLATPLVARAVVFHDDFIVAFLVIATLYVALSAATTSGWFVAGVLAGGALAVKPLGGVALLLVAVVLWSSRSSWRAGAAAVAGSLVGIPWYVGNLVRLGDPMYPFFSGGTDPGLELIVKDHVSYLANRHADRIEFLGWLAFALMGLGLTVGIAYLARRNPRLALGLVLVATAFVAVWSRLHYGTRQLLVLYPVYASVAGVGLALVPRVVARRVAWAPRAAVALVWSCVLGATIWNVAAESRGRTPYGQRTGIYAVALGKWFEQTVGTTLDPPSDNQVFGEITQFWDVLRRQDVNARVLSFDARSWYIPQRVLSAGEDIRAVRASLAGGAAAQHAALLADDVHFVLTRTAVDRYHTELYRIGPWRSLSRRPDLYRLLVKNRLGSLYEVLPARTRHRSP